jgi:hypothetical protein
MTDGNFPVTDCSVALGDARRRFLCGDFDPWLRFELWSSGAPLNWIKKRRTISAFCASISAFKHSMWLPIVAGWPISISFFIFVLFQFYPVVRKQKTLP